MCLVGADGVAVGVQGRSKGLKELTDDGVVVMQQIARRLRPQSQTLIQRVGGQLVALQKP